MLNKELIEIQCALERTKEENPLSLVLGRLGWRISERGERDRFVM